MGSLAERRLSQFSTRPDIALPAPTAPTIGGAENGRFPESPVTVDRQRWGRLQSVPKSNDQGGDLPFVRPFDQKK